MAGTILVSDAAALATNSIDFDYFVDKIREGFLVGDVVVAGQVFEPFDEGGMSFISAMDLDKEAYQVFARAVKTAGAASMGELSFGLHKSQWEQLIAIIEGDPRYIAL